MKSHAVAFLFVFLLPLSSAAFSQAPAAAQIEALKAEIDSFKADYDKRLQALETQLQVLQGKALAAPSPENAVAPTPAAGQPQTVQSPPGAEGAGGPSGQLPVYGGANAGSKVFNPDIAVIGDFLGAAGSNKVNPDPALEMH